MKLFGYDITIHKAQEIEKKKNNIEYLTSSGRNMIGTRLDECGDVQFTLSSFYELQNFSTEATAYKNKIVNWIGKNGIYLERNGEVIEDTVLLQSIIDVFADKTRRLFKDKYFTHHFCAGEIYLYAAKTMSGKVKAQVVDPRTIAYKKRDNNGNIVSYMQIQKSKTREIPATEMYNSIVRYNPNTPYQGMSLYYSMLYDALAEKETARRNFYFFKNNAVPNAIFMLDPEITNKEEIEYAINKIKEQYSGSKNAHKAITSSGLKDVKVLDVKNSDLQMLELRTFAIKKMGVTFQIDPRLIGFVDDVGTYNSIKEIRKEAGETLQALSSQFEEDVNQFYKTFVDQNADFTIRIDSETFSDRESIEESQRKDAELGILTIEEIRRERGLEVEGLPENAKKLMVKNTLQLVENMTPPIVV